MNIKNIRNILERELAYHWFFKRIYLWLYLFCAQRKKKNMERKWKNWKKYGKLNFNISHSFEKYNWILLNRMWPT